MKIAPNPSKMNQKSEKNRKFVDFFVEKYCFIQMDRPQDTYHNEKNAEHSEGDFLINTEKKNVLVHALNLARAPYCAPVLKTRANYIKSTH